MRIPSGIQRQDLDFYEKFTFFPMRSHKNSFIIFWSSISYGKLHTFWRRIFSIFVNEAVNKSEIQNTQDPEATVTTFCHFNPIKV